MSALFQHRWLVAIGLVVGYALLLFTSPVRHALLDGCRALRRYRRLFTIPAGLGICYALFHAGLSLFFYFVLPMEEQPAFGWKFAWAMPPWTPHFREVHTLHDWLGVFFSDPRWQIVSGAVLDGLESLAGLFNDIVTTFPLSGIAAIMLLANWEKHHTTLRTALRKRMGSRAWIVHTAILICAISAILKPVLFGPSLIYLNRVAPGLLLVRWTSIIDWLSGIFEYLFGVGVQVYLILVVYTWLRGITWTPVHLMDMAIRRFSFVVKWAAIVVAFSSLLIDLPRIAAFFRFNDTSFLVNTLNYTDRITRPLLALFLIFFSTIQVTLTFHSESVSRAIAQHWQYLRRFWWQLLWFMIIAGIHLFGLALLDRWLMLGFGGDSTSAGLIWTFIHPLIGALLAAWLLASWVSLYKRFETNRVHSQDWIPF